MPDETNWDDIFRPNGVRADPSRTPLQQASVEPVSQQFPTGAPVRPVRGRGGRGDRDRGRDHPASGRPDAGPGARPDVRVASCARAAAAAGDAAAATAAREAQQAPDRAGSIGVHDGLRARSRSAASTRGHLRGQDPRGARLGAPERLHRAPATASRRSSSIQSGDIGGDVAQTLDDAGVTMTFDAFYDYLLAHRRIRASSPASSAAEADERRGGARRRCRIPRTRSRTRVTIPEGIDAPDGVRAASRPRTGLPVEDFQAAAANSPTYGVPADAPSLEGCLFPATYTFDPGVTAHDVAADARRPQMYQSLDAPGSRREERYRMLTIASIIQREAGPKSTTCTRSRGSSRTGSTRASDCESDATVAVRHRQLPHGVDDRRGARRTPATRGTPTRNAGLPIGPIAQPGRRRDRRGDPPGRRRLAVLRDRQPRTGETVFTTTPTSTTARSRSCRPGATRAPRTRRTARDRRRRRRRGSRCWARRSRTRSRRRCTRAAYARARARLGPTTAIEVADGGLARRSRRRSTHRGAGSRSRCR